MTILHPSSTGSSIIVWFVDGVPVRLVSGTSRFSVIGEPKCAEINGARCWRVRARGEGGRFGVFDLRESDGGWVLVGVDGDEARAGSS